MVEKMTDYKDLIVWQKSMELARIIYRLTSRFPRDEVFGLTNQIRRAVVSIPSNIAKDLAEVLIVSLSIFYGLLKGLLLK